MAEKSRGGTASPSRGHLDDWRLTYGAIVLAAAALFAFTVRSVLSPLVVYGVLMALLTPWVGTRRHVLVVTCATTVLCIWLLVTLGGLLAPFILALAVAYILDPAVDLLERRRIKRGPAIAILAVPVLALLAVLLIIGVPAIAEQVEGLIQRTPDAARRLGATLERLRGRLGAMRIPFLPQFDPQRDILFLNPQRLAEWIQARQARLLQGGVAALLGVGKGVGAIFTILGYVVLTPILLVYLLRDFDRIKAKAASLIPPPRRAGWVEFFREYDRLLARFLRGQLLEAALVGVLTWVGLLILGFPYSGLVGVTAGVFNLVPYLGLPVSIIPVIIISLVTGNVLVSLLKALGVFAVVQFIDGSVTGPRIVGESVGLHPVWVILALAIGGFSLGFVGLLLAMPAAVLIKLLVAEGVKRYRTSRIFRSGQAAASPGDA
jgi:predicted PurR-regulated permease PerM